MTHFPSDFSNIATSDCVIVGRVRPSFLGQHVGKVRRTNTAMTLPLWFSCVLGYESLSCLPVFILAPPQLPPTSNISE